MMYHLKVETCNLELNATQMSYLRKLLSEQEDENAATLLHHLADSYESARQVKYLEQVAHQKNPKMKKIDELEALLEYYKMIGESDDEAVKELTALYDEMKLPADLRIV